MKKFLCVIIDRVSGKELSSYKIEASDWYYARHKAANKYRHEINKNFNLPAHILERLSKDWYVDSCEI